MTIISVKNIRPIEKYTVQDYRGARVSGAQALIWIMKKMLIAQLKDKVKYDAEFSSIAEACIRKKAPEPLIAEVFQR